MVILNSGKPSDSSTTESSDSPSDDDKKRFFKQPSGPRQASSSSESSTDESSGDGDPHPSSVPQSKRPPPQAKVRDPSPSVKSKKDNKRNREEIGGQEQYPSSKRKSSSKKADAGKKPSPLPQRETLPRVTVEKTPVKSVKEKKSSSSKDEKNPRRQTVLDATTPATPSKKVQHLWSEKDEMVFANALLSSLERGVDISKKVSQVHQEIKDSMEHEYTKGQFYEKVRRLRNKCNTIVEKLKEGNMREELYPFKTPHEKSIFRICKQLWYADPASDDDEEMKEAPPKDAGRLLNPGVAAEEGDANDNSGGEDSGDSQEQDGEEDQEDGDTTVSVQQNEKIAPVTGTGNGSAVQPDEKLALINGLNELRTDCMKMIEAAEARTAAFIDKQFKSAKESLQRGDGGIRPGLNFSSINRELMDGIQAAWDFPLVDGARAEKLEQKWRELRIAEMEVFSRRLNLLQEECKMFLEGLKSPKGSGRS